MPRGGRAVFATAGLVFISYAGITKIAAVAEEVKNPGKNIPLAMFLAFSLVMILYLSVIFITIGLVDSAKLSRSLAPIPTKAKALLKDKENHDANPPRVPKPAPILRSIKKIVSSALGHCSDKFSVRKYRRDKQNPG